MTPSAQKPLFTLHTQPLKVFFICCLVVVICQFRTILDAFSFLPIQPADSSLRLAVVRALLEGQSWFDTRMYRILPPEGLSLHWSRYVDAPIAGLILAFNAIMPTVTAERVAIIVYPLMLLLAFIGIVAAGCRSLFGTVGISAGIVCIATMPVLVFAYFGIGALDHHNIQIVLIAALFVALFPQERPFVFAFLSGTAGALSIAVGFEGLPMVALAGALCGLRFILGEDGSRQRLMGFGLGLGLTTPLFFLGQTGPSDWWTVTCDYLSYPWVGLCGLAGLWALLTGGFCQKNTQIKGRTLAALGFGAPIGVLTLWVLAPCYAGPYTHLSDELMTEVIKEVTESRSIIVLISQSPAGVLSSAAPIFVCCLLVGLTLAPHLPKAYIANRPTQQQWAQRRVCELLVTMALILALTFIQYRALILGLGLFPILFASASIEVVNWFKQWPNKVAVSLRIAIVCLMTGIAWALFGSGVEALKAEEAQDGAAIETTNTNMSGVEETRAEEESSAPTSCLDARVLAPLNELPPGRILAAINLGPSIVVHTHHDALSGSYHRSADALYNGTLAFLAGEAELQRISREFDADYLVFCLDNENSPKPEDIDGFSLDNQNIAEWLEPIKLNAVLLETYKIHFSK